MSRHSDMGSNLAEATDFLQVHEQLEEDIRVNILSFNSLLSTPFSSLLSMELHILCHITSTPFSSLLSMELYILCHITSTPFFTHLEFLEIMIMLCIKPFVKFPFIWVNMVVLL